MRARAARSAAAPRPAIAAIANSASSARDEPLRNILSDMRESRSGSAAANLAAYSFPAWPGTTVPRRNAGVFEP